MVISAHTSSKSTIVYCNCTFEGGDGGYDSDECSDDGESRGGRPTESPTCTPLFIEGRIFKKGNLGTRNTKSGVCAEVPHEPVSLYLNWGQGAGVPHEYPHLHHVTTHTFTKSLPNPHLHHVTTHTFTMSKPTPSPCHYPHHHVKTHTFTMSLSTPSSGQYLFAPMCDHTVCSNVGVMSRNLGWLQTCPLSCSLLLTLLDF